MSEGEKKYKRLSSEFKWGGWWYREIMRVSDVGLYEQFGNGNFQTCMGFAVVILRKKPTTVLPRGQSYPAREVFPAPSRFGYDGFFFMPRGRGRQRAETKFRELVAKRRPGGRTPRPKPQAEERSDGECPTSPFEAKSASG